MLPEKKAVGIWIRVSTEDQARGESPEHHEKRARHYAEAKGWNIKEVYHLEAVSGKAVIAHPEAQKMLGHIKSGHITGLIFSKLARLARNTRELLDFADRFNESDADLISLQESIDTSTPAGRLFYTMIAAMAQWEREEIASRVAASVPIRAKLGKPLGGQAPFGYVWKDKQLIPEPKEVPVAKLIYEYFQEHKRKRTVARLLNDQGYRTRNGSRFSDTTVSRLLRDPTAKGKHRLNYTKSLGDGKAWVMKPEEEWEFLDVEPIISAQVWDVCRAILREQEQKYKKPTRRPIHLFTGFVYCHCGGKMAIPSNSPKYTCPKCKNKILPDALDTIFHEQLKGYFSSPEELRKLHETADSVLLEKKELLTKLEQDRAKLERQKEKVSQAYYADEISVKTFGAELRPIEERLEAVKGQIPDLQGEIDFLKIKSLSSDEVFSQAQSLYTNWPNLVFDEKRRIVEGITDKISIGNDEVNLSLAYMPSPHELTTVEQRNVIPALPFCSLVLTAKKPINPAYPKSLVSLGDHLRKRRLDLGLLQKEVALTLGVDKMTINSWETGRYRPQLAILPRIIAFLGYTPPDLDQGSTSPADRLRAYRISQGLSQEKFARLIGVDEGTVAQWEKGRLPSPKHSRKLRGFGL